MGAKASVDRAENDAENGLLDRAPELSIESLSSDSSVYESDDNEKPKPQQDQLAKLKEKIAARGVNWREPTFSDVEGAEDSDEFEFLAANIRKPEEFYQRLNGKGVERVEKSQKELEEEFESIKERSKEDRGYKAYEPTYEDYLKGKDTSGQRVLGKYEVQTVNKLSDGTVQVICDGPSGDRVEDFWTECFDFNAGLVVMNCAWVTRRGVLCHHYVPLDKKMDYSCGKIVIARLTGVEKRHGHRVQKLAVRHTDIDEKSGWFPIWHCQRAPQEDPNKDYNEENEQFNKLKLELLAEVKKTTYLEHGPMPYCASGAGRGSRPREPYMKNLNEFSDVEV